MRINTEIIPAEIKAGLEAEGQNWAQQEFELYQEQNRKRDEWTSGCWCGPTNQLDGVRNENEEDSNRMVVEQLIDDVARATWESLWDANEATR